MNLQDRLQELQTLDAQNPGAWPTWVRILAVILLMVGLLVAGYIYGVKPKIAELDKVVREETTLRTEFERKQRKVAALDAYKEQLQEMERSFGAMLRQLPSKAEVPNLLNDIAQTRVASSLEEELFQPQGTVTKEFYAELPNKIVVTGDYHQLGAFVSAVAGLPRIVTVDNVEIKPQGKDGNDKLRMNAVVKTYRYLDESEGGG